MLNGFRHVYVLRKVGIDTILEWLCAKQEFLLGCAILEWYRTILEWRKGFCQFYR